MSTEFVNQMWPHALRVSQQTGLDPRLVIAQSALETGWGRSAPGNNYFGIKSHGKPGGNNLGTWEVVNGQRVNINDSFRAYDGMGASADGYAQFLMENPRYRGMLAADGLDAQIDALASSGYATDPQYGTKVRSIATGITPPSQDIADETMAVLGLSPMSNQPSAPAGRTDSTISTRGPEPMQEYQPEKAGGILGMLFPNMTADRQDSIALALSGLGRGNPALEASLRDRMGGRRDDRKEFEQQQQQRAQMNRTLQVLGQAGFDEQDLALAAENPEYMRAMVGQLAQRRLAGEQRVKGVEIDGRLVNPYTGELMGDFSTPENQPAVMSLAKVYEAQGLPLPQGVDGNELIEVELDPQGRVVGMSRSGPLVDITNTGSSIDDEYWKTQGGNIADRFSGISSAASQAATIGADLQALQGLYRSAPNGPLQGRLAEMFPEANTASAAIEGIRKRIAPQFRVEGSGSTSDVEYAGMLQSLGSMKNDPRANEMLIDLMLAKQELLQRQRLIINQVRPGGLSPYDADRQIAELEDQFWVSNPRVQSIRDFTGQQGAAGAPGDDVNSVPTFNEETGSWE